MPRLNRHDPMNRKQIQLSLAYAATLARQLKRGRRASLSPASRLGRRAVAVGLETLDLARIHRQALATLKLPPTQKTSIAFAGNFFTEANSAIEETHRLARQTRKDLSQLVARLDRRTGELAVSHRQLQWNAIRRKRMEKTFAKRGKHHQKCLEESLELQKRLRQLTHQVLAAQEDERKKISCELQDEIAQTLLGINVRLLCLKQEARKHAKGLKNTIASTQRLVANSARSVRRAGRKIRSL